MLLSDWIKSVGNKHAAKLLVVSERTIESYRQGRRRPRPEMAIRMSKLTGGKVSFAECYPRD
jgi:DNA-binding transcriptional regulator YdaS (Cro superfamily)